MPRGGNLSEIYDGFLDFSNNKLTYNKIKIPSETLLFSLEIPYNPLDFDYLMKIALESSYHPKIIMSDMSLRRIEIVYSNGVVETRYNDDPKFWEVANSYLKGIKN